MATILTKRSNTASSVPVAGDLTNSTGGAELAVNTADKRLFTKDSGGTVVELGTNPSTFSLPNGTANGVAYLNGSKVLTTGSALTFDGTSLGVSTGSTTGLMGVVSVNGYSSNTDQFKYLMNWSGAGVWGIGVTASSSGGMIFGQASSIAGGVSSELMRLTSTGLGIGTSSPGAKLDVNGVIRLGWYASGQSITAFNGDQTNQQQIFMKMSGTDGQLFVTRAAGTPANLLFGTEGTERARIDSSGNLGLGVTPSAVSTSDRVLQVRNFLFDDNTNGYGILRYNNYFNGTNDVYLNTGAVSAFQMQGNAFKWYQAASGTAGNAITFTEAMTLNSSGLLKCPAIYTNTNGAAANVIIGADGFFYRSTSSLKYKRDIQSQQHGLADVMKLRPVTYKGNSEADGETVYGGLIAEEVDAAGLTEFVQYAEDGSPDALAYSNMVSLAFKAIQEQQAIIDAQSTALNELKAQLTFVSADVAALKGN